jgi:hypothetical protein
MNQLDIFNSLGPYEQCEWIVKLIDNGSNKECEELIDNGSNKECEELYKLIDDDSDKTKLFKSLFTIMVDTTNNHKNFQTTSKVINEIYPLWITELRDIKLKEII